MRVFENTSLIQNYIFQCLNNKIEKYIKKKSANRIRFYCNANIKDKVIYIIQEIFQIKIFLFRKKKIYIIDERNKMIFDYTIDEVI